MSDEISDWEPITLSNPMIDLALFSLFKIDHLFRCNFEVNKIKTKLWGHTIFFKLKQNIYHMCRAYLSLFSPITLEWSPIIILYLIYKIRDTTAIQTDTIVCSRYKSRRNTLTLVYFTFVGSEEKISATKVI